MAGLMRALAPEEMSSSARTVTLERARGEKTKQSSITIFQGKVSVAKDQIRLAVQVEVLNHNGRGFIRWKANSILRSMHGQVEGRSESSIAVLQ